MSTQQQKRLFHLFYVILERHAALVTGFVFCCRRVLPLLFRLELAQDGLRATLEL